MERISFYIPAYNAQNTINYSIDSLLRQTYKIDEIIVIDDNSTDKTFEIVKKYEKVKIIKNYSNFGLGYNRNLAIKKSINNIIGSIDADVELEDTWLEVLIEEISKENIVMCGGNMIEKNLKNEANIWRAKYYSQNWGDKFILDPPFLYGCNTLLKKSIWEKVNGYNEELKTNGEDINFVSKVKSKFNYQIIYQPKAKCYHHQDDDVESLSRRVWRYHSLAYKIKDPSIKKLIKISIKQLKFFLMRFFRSISNYDKADIKISFRILINFIKLEYKNLKKKK